MKLIAIIPFFLIYGSSILAQDQILLEDSNIPGTDTVWVFTPDNYDSERSYPVVYMLHGYSGDYQQWDMIMDGQEYADVYEMIIVCPDGFYNSWYFDSPEKENSQFSTFFFGVLTNKIESRYAIDSDNRFITGLSMGGHGAFHLFIQNPDFFKSAGSTSGVMDLRVAAGKYELHEHLGAFQDNQQQWLEMSAAGNIQKMKESGKELIFDCGTEDPFFECNFDLYKLLLDHKITITFISQPGKHDWDYWNKSIKAHFEFFNSKVE